MLNSPDLSTCSGVLRVRNLGICLQYSTYAYIYVPISRQLSSWKRPALEGSRLAICRVRVAVGLWNNRLARAIGIGMGVGFTTFLFIFAHLLFLL